MKKVVLYSSVLAAGLAMAATANAAAPMSPKVNDVQAIELASPTQVKALKEVIKQVVADNKAEIANLKTTDAYKEATEKGDAASYYAKQVYAKVKSLTDVNTKLQSDVVTPVNYETDKDFEAKTQLVAIFRSYSKEVTEAAEAAVKLYDLGATPGATEYSSYYYGVEAEVDLATQLFNKAYYPTIKTYKDPAEVNAVLNGLNSLGITVADENGDGKIDLENDYQKNVLDRLANLDKDAQAKDSDGTPLTKAEYDEYYAQVQVIVEEMGKLQGWVDNNNTIHETNEAALAELAQEVQDLDDQIKTYPDDVQTAIAAALQDIKDDLKDDQDKEKADYEGGLYWDGKDEYKVLDPVSKEDLEAAITALRETAAYETAKYYLAELDGKRTDILTQIEEMEKDASTHTPAITDDANLCNNTAYTDATEKAAYAENPNGRDVAENVAALEAIDQRIADVTAAIEASHTAKTSEADLAGEAGVYAELGVDTTTKTVKSTVAGSIMEALQGYLTDVTEDQVAHEKTEAEYAKKIVDGLAAIKTANDAVKAEVAVGDTCADGGHAGYEYKNTLTALAEDHEFEYNGNTLTYGATNNPKGLVEYVDANYALGVITGGLAAKDHVSKGYYTMENGFEDQFETIQEEIARTEAAWKDNQASHKTQIEKINAVETAYAAADAYVKGLDFYKDWTGKTAADFDLYCNEDLDPNSPYYAEIAANVPEVVNVLNAYLGYSVTPDKIEDVKLLEVMKFAYDGLNSLLSKRSAEIADVNNDIATNYTAGTSIEYLIDTPVEALNNAIADIENIAAFAQLCHEGYIFAHTAHLALLDLQKVDEVCHEAFDETKEVGTRTGISYDNCDELNECALHSVDGEAAHQALKEAIYAACNPIGDARVAGTCKADYATLSAGVAALYDKLAEYVKEYKEVINKEHIRLEDDAFDKVNREIDVVYQAFLDAREEYKLFNDDQKALCDELCQGQGYNDWADLVAHVDADTFTTLEDIHSFTALRDKVLDDHDLHHSMEQREFNAKTANAISKVVLSVIQPVIHLKPIDVEYAALEKNFNENILPQVNLDEVPASVKEDHDAYNCYQQAVADAKADLTAYYLTNGLDVIRDEAYAKAHAGELNADRRDYYISLLKDFDTNSDVEINKIIKQFNDYIEFLVKNCEDWAEFNKQFDAVKAQHEADVAAVNKAYDDIMNAEDCLDATKDHSECYEKLRDDALAAVNDEYKTAALDTKDAADKAHHDATATPADNYKTYGTTHTLSTALEGLLNTLNSYDVQDVIGEYNTELDKLVKNDEAYTRLDNSLADASDALADVIALEGSECYNHADNVVLWPGTENEVTVTTIPNLQKEIVDLQAEIDAAWHPAHEAVAQEEALNEKIEALNAKIDLLKEYIEKNNEAYKQNQADLAALQDLLDAISNPDEQASEQHEGASVVDYITNEKQAIQDMIDAQETLIENDYKAGHAVDRDRQAEEDAIKDAIDLLEEHIAAVNDAVKGFFQDAQALSEQIQNTIDALNDLDLSGYVVVNEGLGVNEDHVAHVEAIRDYYVAQYQAQLDLIGTYEDTPWTELMQKVNTEYQEGDNVEIDNIRRTLLDPIYVVCEGINAGFEKDMAQTDANIAAYRSFLADADEFFNTTIDAEDDAHTAEYREKYAKCVDTFLPYMEARDLTNVPPFEAVACCTADPSFVPFNDLIEAIKASKDGILESAAASYELTHNGFMGAIDHDVPAVSLDDANDRLDAQKDALTAATDAFDAYVEKFADFLENERVYRDLQTKLNEVREAADKLDEHLQTLDEGYTCGRCDEHLDFDAEAAIKLVDKLIAHLDRDGAGLEDCYKALNCVKNEQEWADELADDAQKVNDTKAELNHLFETMVDQHEQIHANEDAAGELIGNAIQGATGLEAQWTQMFNATVNYDEFENDPFVQEVLDEYREKFVEVSREIDDLKAQITAEAEANELATWNTEYAQDGGYAVVPGTAEARYLDIEAIQQELTKLVNEFNDAIDQAHIKDNAKDIFSDQYFFTVGFEMFNHIDITEGATALVSDITCTDIPGYVADLGVLVNGEKQNELTFSLDNGMARNRILWTTLEAGEATAVIPAGAMTVDGFTTLHDVTINFNVVDPVVVDETELNAVAVQGTNKLIIKVEKPVDATYTDKTIVASTDCGTFSFADAQFNEADMTVTFDIPANASSVDLPEGFLTFRVGDNKISRSAAKQLVVVVPTSIEAILAMGSKVEVYDLQGRRVSTEAIQKGQTYVIDGVKTFVK